MFESVRFSELQSGVSNTLSTTQILKGFAAGFLATLVFRQLAVAILSGIGLAAFGAWNLSPSAPRGVPAVLSLSFWGGIWGIILSLVHAHFGHGTLLHLHC